MAFQPLRHPRWEHRLCPTSSDRSAKIRMDDRGNLRPHAVRINSVSAVESVMDTCHMLNLSWTRATCLRCKAPVTSSTEISGAGPGCRLETTGGSVLELEELELEELDPSSEPESSSKGASTSTGTSVCSANLKYFQSTAGGLFRNNWIWKEGSSMGICPPLANGVVGLKPSLIEDTIEVCNWRAPWTSSLLYKRVDDCCARCFPCKRLCSSGRFSCWLQLKNVLFKPWIVYERESPPNCPDWLRQGRCSNVRMKYRASAYDNGWAGDRIPCTLQLGTR